MGNETTPAARLGFQVLVKITPEGGLPHLANSRNISATGVLVETAVPLDVGARIRVRLFLPGGPGQVELSGEVSRAGEETGEGRLYGVRFVDTTPEIEDAINGYISRRITRSTPRP